MSAAFVFPEVSEWPKPATSKTRINTYRTCPWRYDAEYESRRPREFVLAAEIFGRAMHRAVALFYAAYQQAIALKAADLVEDFAEAWNADIANALAPVRFASGYDRYSMFGLGSALLEIFLRDVRPRRVVAVEQRFAVPLGSLALIGIMDLVEVDDDGEPIVVDLKTGCGCMSERQASTQLDGRIYAFALKQMGMLEAGDDVLTRYDVLIKRKRPAMRPTFDTQSAASIASFPAWVQPILDGIRLGRFHRRRGWYCKYCPFQLACERESRRSS